MLGNLANSDRNAHDTGRRACRSYLKDQATNASQSGRIITVIQYLTDHTSAKTSEIAEALGVSVPAPALFLTGSVWFPAQQNSHTAVPDRLFLRTDQPYSFCSFSISFPIIFSFDCRKEAKEFFPFGKISEVRPFITSPTLKRFPISTVLRS